MKRECSGCHKKRDASSFVGERGRTCAICRKARSRASARATHLWKTYEITYEEHAEMSKDGCNACGGRRSYSLPVDHDHALEKLFGVRASVRGVLCKRCNKTLRDVRDDVTVLEGLIRYLNNPPAKKVLFP